MWKKKSQQGTGLQRHLSAAYNAATTPLSSELVASIIPLSSTGVSLVRVLYLPTSSYSHKVKHYSWIINDFMFETQPTLFPTWKQTHYGTVPKQCRKSFILLHIFSQLLPFAQLNSPTTAGLTMRRQLFFHCYLQERAGTRCWKSHQRNCGGVGSQRFCRLCGGGAHLVCQGWQQGTGSGQKRDKVNQNGTLQRECTVILHYRNSN